MIQEAKDGADREPSEFPLGSARPSKNDLKKRVVRLTSWAAAAAGGVVLLLFFLPKIFSDKQPADFRIDGSKLVITNKGGRELWRYEANFADLKNEEWYRLRFQNKSVVEEPSGGRRTLSRLLIRDMNRDGRNEVLYVPFREEAQGSGRLVILDSQGHAIWDLETGQETTVGNRVFAPDFTIRGIALVDLYKDGKPEILVISHAWGEYPTRVLLLDLEKKVLGEYWNAGQIDDYVFADLNRDDVPEILLAGQNNEYDRPCLLALDVRRMIGVSPQTETFHFIGKEKGNEIYYLLFPPSPVDELFRPGITVNKMDLLAGERFRILIHPSNVQFELNYGLNFLTVTLSRSFERLYNDEFRAGRLKDPYDESRIWHNLAAGFRWYDSKTKSWSPTWAMSNPWPDPELGLLTTTRGRRYHHCVRGGISSEPCGPDLCAPRKRNLGRS